MAGPSKARMRSCHEGKRRYETLEQAQAAAGMMRKRKAKQGVPIVSFVRAYGCACGGFHVGKSRDIDWNLVTKVSLPVKLSEKHAAAGK
jgi:hypothetical protein